MAMRLGTAQSDVGRALGNEDEVSVDIRLRCEGGGSGGRIRQVVVVPGCGRRREGLWVRELFAPPFSLLLDFESSLLLIFLYFFHFNPP